MTTPASALSFHCMICFEEFHHADRYPVVLPCGHTYVCHVCAERLDKCMECRTLLAWSIPNPNARSNTNNAAGRSGWSNRTTGRATPQPPPIVMEKKRLPLPKNVVLLSLMEATELATEVENTTTRIDSLLQEAEEHDVDDEEEKIRMSTSLTIGACGTYVVADKDGLDVYPSRPNVVGSEPDTNHEENDMPTEEDVNSLVRFFHLDHKIEVSHAEGNLKSASSEDSALIALHYGDRVQIVSYEDDGWAKLARGYGYVRADTRQLVKIGGSVDKACRLEAYLHALATQKRELKAECGKIETRFTGLMNSLQASLFNDEDLTVLAGDTFENDDAPHIVIPQDDHREHLPASFSDDSDLLKQPHGLVRQPTPPMEGLASCSVGSVLQAMSATLGGDDDSLPQMPSAFPTAGDQSLQKRTHTQARMSPPRSRELSAEAEAWRERYYRQPLRGARPRAGVDFRTGMSGHQGLVSYMVHPHSYLDGQEQAHQLQQRELPKMSSHSGLSRTHRSSQPTRLSPPSFSYSSSRDTRDQS